MEISNRNVTLSWDSKHLTKLLLVDKDNSDNYIDPRELLDKVKKWMEDNEDSVNEKVRNLSRLAVGIYGPAEWCFSYGFYVHKYLAQLEKNGNVSYNLDSEEELITSEKIKEIVKDLIKQQRKKFDKMEEDIDSGKLDLGGFEDDGNLIDT